MSRVSYRNNKALEYLKGIESHLQYRREDNNFFSEHGLDFIKEFNDNKHIFSRNVTFVSENFIKAKDQASKQLKDIYFKSIHDDSEINMGGTYVIGHNTYMVKHYKNGSFLDSELSVFVFTNEGVPLVMDYMRTKNNEFKAWISNLFNKVEKADDELFVQRVISQVLIDVSLIILFKKYATVEIIESKAKSKTVQNGTKYLNETDLNIEYLDSKWFTTLVHSEGFKVRGFFRLQPKKKDGEWTKELIWIDEFEKQGYHRKAGILNQQKEE